MANSRNTRRKPKRKVKMGTSIVFSVVVMCAIAMTFNCVDLMQKNAKLDEQAKVIEKQLIEEQQRAQELEKQEAYMKTNEYIEDTAHQKLGLVYSDEIYITPEAN